MEKRVFEFMIFQQKQLIFYVDPQVSEIQIDYQKLQLNHRIQNIYSFSEKFASTIKELHPNPKTVVKNFKTKQYQFSMFETINGVKLILVTSVRYDNSPELTLNLLFETYVSLVKKNYLCVQGVPIRLARFESEVKKILSTLQEK